MASNNIMHVHDHVRAHVHTRHLHYNTSKVGYYYYYVAIHFISVHGQIHHDYSKKNLLFMMVNRYYHIANLCLFYSSLYLLMY